MAAAGDQAPGSAGLLGSVLPSAGHTRKMQPKECYRKGHSQSLQGTGSISREAGRVAEEGGGVGRGVGGWR